MFYFTALPALSLYIHIPWCVKKCPYCDFNSHKVDDAIPENLYVDALISDLEQSLPSIWGRSIQTIFIGGGTPSLFSAEAYDRLFSKLRARLAIAPYAEITLEANPSSVEQQRFAEYRTLGINRLSIGVQSFNDLSLKALGRVHSGRQAIKAIEAGYAAGFDNINLDLMFGLPEQTKQTADQDIETAIALNPEHLSYYQLTLEPNTLFYQQPPELPEEDPIIDWQYAGQEKLAKAGYQQYEVSAYAKKNQRCQHNLNYWQFGDYLGIGAGAHSKISDAAEQSITRTAKLKHPQQYMENAAIEKVCQTKTQVKRIEVGFEFMLNSLRLTEGFATPLFQQQTGVPLSIIDSPLRNAEKQGLLDWDIHRIKATDKGQRYLNSLIELFLP